MEKLLGGVQTSLFLASSFTKIISKCLPKTGILTLMEQLALSLFPHKENRITRQNKLLILSDT